MLVVGCFTDAAAVDDDPGGSSSSTGSVAGSPPTASSTTSGYPADGGTAGGGADGGDESTGTQGRGSSSDESGWASGSEGSSSSDSGSDGSSSTGSADPTVYADCFDDEGAMLCTGSCVQDPRGLASACAPACDGGECPEDGSCLDDVADETAALVCVLVCNDDDECPGQICALTPYTARGAPLRVCMWP